MDLSNSEKNEKGKVKVKIIPTEIFSRIVGYYRPVQNWNKGKVEEFRNRKIIDMQKTISLDKRER